MLFFKEHEELKSLCDAFSAGNLNERKHAIISLFNKLRHDRRFVVDNAVKVGIIGVSLFLNQFCYRFEKLLRTRSIILSKAILCIVSVELAKFPGTLF